MNLHFISGLPRSGSTLLAAILRQNPLFTAGMASPVAAIYRSLESAMAQRTEGAIFVTDEQREALLRGVFGSFYPQSEGVVFDTNRMWAARLPALSRLFPDAKVICCVRDVAWIIDSFERLYRRNPFEPSGVYGYDNTGTIYDRAQLIQSGNGVVGYALNAMREALAGEQADRVLLVEYDHLCKDPARELDRIYSFIGEPAFKHDFSHVEFSASEFDRSLGARGLHDVYGPVEVRQRKTILPPDIFARYANDQFWRKARVK